MVGAPLELSPFETSYSYSVAGETQDNAWGIGRFHGGVSYVVRRLSATTSEGTERSLREVGGDLSKGMMLTRNHKNQHRLMKSSMEVDVDETMGRPKD